MRAGAHIGQPRHYFLFYDLYIATREAHIERHAGGFRFQGEVHPFIVLEPGNVTTLAQGSAGAGGREAAFETSSLVAKYTSPVACVLVTPTMVLAHAFEREGIVFALVMQNSFTALADYETGF